MSLFTFPSFSLIFKSLVDFALFKVTGNSTKTCCFEHSIVCDSFSALCCTFIILTRVSQQKFKLSTIHLPATIHHTLQESYCSRSAVTCLLFSEARYSMPRRPPPTPLRLYVGPLPPRSQPKHTLPSVPRPAYAASMSKTKSREHDVKAIDLLTMLPCTATDPPPAIINFASQDGIAGHRRRLSGSPTLRGSEGVLHMGSSRRGSLESMRQETENQVRYRGPWDHSASIKLPFDISTVVTPPMPVAINSECVV